MFDVQDSRELQAIVLAFKLADRRVRNVMKATARKTLNAVWRPALASRATSKLQARVLVAGARAKVGSDSFSMLAATRKRPLSGGLIPADEWHGAEFGARRKGLERFGARVDDGKVIYPATRDEAPRVVAAWIEGAVAGLATGTEMETR